jgi:Ca-activated chloride channel family protein
LIVAGNWLLRSIGAFTALASITIAYAQPTFRSAVDLVTVQVTVTSNDQTRRVGELGPGDFKIYEDGVLQNVAIVGREPRALSICILLDSSPSMASRQPTVIRAVDTLIKELAKEDEVAIVMFAAKARVALQWTSAPAARAFSWYEWRLSLGTALIDAMKEALALVERAANPVPVILIVSDGEDNASGTPLSKLVATRRQSETLVYGIRTEARASRNAVQVNRTRLDQLPDIVGDSGGTVFRARDEDGAEAAARALVEELRAQYTLGYAPTKPLDGKYRTLKVVPTNPALRVRHREGYLAQPRD